MEPLTDKQLEDLLSDIESDRCERKENFNRDSRAAARQAVCAFANDMPNHNLPGILCIGVKDNGQPARLKITDLLLQSLADMKTDGNILPLPALSVEKRMLKDIEIAVVTVMPSDMPPVKYDGRIWIRTGPRRALANEQEERILNEKRRHKLLPFDMQPIPSATTDDISKIIFENEYLPAAFAPDVLENNNRSYHARLASCKMVVAPDDPTPTVVGMLALGKSPQDFLPGAYIQFLRIDGTALTDQPVDEETIGGSMVNQLNRIQQILRVHNQRKFSITSSPTHHIESPYPIAALQQIVYNAILHRTYENTHAPVRLYWFSNRIEIHSPGGVYGNVTPDTFGAPGVTDYRNPNIADVLKTFGFVQRFGRGIAIARDEMKRNGNPELDFDINENAIVCTLPTRKMVT